MFPRSVDYTGERLERTFSDREVGFKNLTHSERRLAVLFLSFFFFFFQILQRSLTYPPEVSSGDVKRTIASYKEKFPFHILRLFLLFFFFFFLK